MSLAITKKPSLENTNKKKHETSSADFVNFHSVKLNPQTQTPIVQLKPICPCDGGCPRCTGVIQPKLTVGEPNDIYEQEADRIADEVMRMPAPAIQTKPA
jgi:hypothetical protein